MDCQTMDCQTAQHLLELAIPSGSDAGENALAVRHVATCDHCQAVFHDRELFDLRAGRVCRDVPVPIAARDRLLALLAQRETPASGAAPVSEPVPEPAVPEEAASSNAPHRDVDRPISPLPASPVPVRSRRRWLKTVAAAACLLLGVAGWGWHLQHPAVPVVAWSDIAQASVLVVPQEGATLATFANGKRPQLPGTMECPPSLLEAVPQTLQVGDQVAAVYFFTMGSGRTQREGRLIVMPVHLVREPPEATAFLGGGAGYHGHFATTAWVEDGLVFLCCVSGGDEELRRLLPRNSAT